MFPPLLCLFPRVLVVFLVREAVLDLLAPL